MTARPDPRPLLVEVVGGAALPLDELGVPHRLIDTIDTATAATREHTDWPSDLLVWATADPVPAWLQRRFPRLDSPLPGPVFHVAFDPEVATPLPWSFRCNLCGVANRRTAPLIDPRSCCRCLSNVRYRAIAHALTSYVLQGDVALVDAPTRADLRVLGIGDWPPLARRLSAHFDYVNTHLDATPRLDLQAPLPRSMVGAHDVVLAGDVLEHVAAPLAPALGRLRRLVRPGGIAIVTVPWHAADHVEHFPDLYRYEVRDDGDGAVLRNERRDGTTERFDGLRFHGPGHSLEMRVFSETSLCAALVDAGFETVSLCTDPAIQHGIAARPGRPVPVIAEVAAV